MALTISDELKRKYDRYYDEGESEWRRISAMDKVQNIRSFCTPYSHRKVLEMGAGDGSILHSLSQHGFAEQYYAIEISDSAVETIRRRRIDNLVECRLFNGSDVPYDDAEFDLVVLSHVLEHLEYPRRLLYEASRVGKLVFVEVPLEDHCRLPRDYVETKAGHINFFSPKTIRALIQTCGLEVIRQGVSHVSFEVYRYQFGKLAALRYLPKELLLRVVPSLATKLATYHGSLLCRKTPT